MNTAKRAAREAELAPLMLQTVHAMRTRLSDPERWCQGTLAVDMHDRVRSPSEPSACAWCLMGAAEVELEIAWRADGAVESHRAPFRTALFRVLDTHVAQFTERRLKYVAPFNDASSHAEVLAFLDFTIAHLEGMR